jgi:hypothetical protein
MVSPDSSAVEVFRSRGKDAATRGRRGEAAPADERGLGADRIDALVDLVVDRIEQRVIDELERRGRRHERGVF